EERGERGEEPERSPGIGRRCSHRASVGCRERRTPTGARARSRRCKRRRPEPFPREEPNMQTRFFWLALAGLLSTSTAAADGLSDKFSETLDVSLDVRAGLLGGGDLFTGAEGTPARIRDGARLSGVGQEIGAALRGGLTLNGLRFGLGLGAFRV